MKKNTNMVWRLAIAILLVMSMGMAMVVPAAAAGVGTESVTSITIKSPGEACPLYLRSGDSFDVSFEAVGQGIGAFAVLLGEYAVYVETDVDFALKTKYCIEDISLLADLNSDGVADEAIPNDIYDLTIIAQTTGQTFLFSAVAPNSVFVDDFPPEVAITKPADLTFVSGCVQIEADAVDQVSGVTKVEFFYLQEEDADAVNSDSVAAFDAATWTKIGADATAPYCIGWDTTCLEDGLYWLAAVACDKLGNLGVSTAILVCVDNTKPTELKVLSPQAGDNWQNGETYNIEWVPAVDANLGSYPITIDLYNGDCLEMNIATGIENTGSYSWELLGVIPGDDYKIVITATDLAGNSTTAKSGCFSVYSIDNTTPDVTLKIDPTTTINDKIFITGKIDISADASDADSGITRVKFAYSEDNGKTWKGIATAKAPPYEVKDFDTSCIPDGQVLFSATAINAAGAWAVAVGEVWLDNSPPEVSWVAPGQGVYKDGLVLTVSAKDVLTGIEEVEFYYSTAKEPKPEDWIEIEGTVTQDAVDPCLYSIIWDIDESGEYKLQAEAVNGVDLEGYSSIVCVTIDTIAPDGLELVFPVGGEVFKNGKSYEVQWTAATDEHLGANPYSIEVLRDDKLVWTVTGLPADCTTYCWNVKNFVPSDDYEMVIIATDEAGNKAYVESEDFAITMDGEDSTVPFVELAAPADDAVVSGITKVKANAYDDESGIQAVDFIYSLDGQEWVLIGSAGYPPFAVDWDTSAIVNAKDVMVAAVATNGVGLTNEDVNKCIIIDNSIPMIKINDIDVSCNKFPVITGIAADECSEVKCVDILIKKVVEKDFIPTEEAVAQVDTADWDCLFWNGKEWTDKECWMPATGSSSAWSFDASCIPFETDTLYIVVARATDCGGNSGYDKECVFVRTDSIHLYPGWNFISVPRQLSGDYDTFGKLLANIAFCKALSYDPCNGWVPLTADSCVEPLNGYWIVIPADMKHGANIKFRYDNGPILPASKKLAGDAWNAIGPSGDKVADGWDFDRDEVDTTTYDSAHGNWVWVSDNLKSIEGSWSTLIYWDNKYQRYAKTILAPGDDEFMKLGHGYWIWISNPNGDTLSSVTGDHKKY